MQRVVLIFMAMMIAGCSSVYQAGSQPYRMRGDDRAVSISGSVEMVEKLISITHRVRITIDGEAAISGDLDGTAAGVLTGRWRGKSVEADCAKVGSSGTSYNIRCLVLIENERAASLTF